jgi:hypothetical protein
MVSDAFLVQRTQMVRQLPFASPVGPSYIKNVPIGLQHYIVSRSAPVGPTVSVDVDDRGRRNSSRGG